MSPRQGTALITGGGRRLGAAMGLSLASWGYDLVIHYHSSAEGAQQLQKEAADFGAQCHLIQGDLSDPEFSQSLIQQAYTCAPQLNLLINNASIFYPKDLQETDLAELDKFMDLHLKAPLVLSRDFAQQIQKGLIVNMLDAQIQKIVPGYLPYQLSKKALLDLTLHCAKALGPEIRVNAIAPGHMLPPIEGNADPSQKWLKKTPLARLGSPDDINQALKTLLESPYLTGQILWVDGGLRI